MFARFQIEKLAEIFGSHENAIALFYEYCRSMETDALPSTIGNRIEFLADHFYRAL